MKHTKLKIILFVITQVLKGAIKKHAAVRKHVNGRSCVVQIVLKDGSAGRTYTFTNGEVTSKAGIHPNPEVTMLFKDIDTALTFLTPGVTQAEIIHAAKNFRVMVLGPDASVVWFMQLMNLTQTAALEQGIPMPDGTRRFTTNTNGGPLFVYVKDDKIVRMTPIDLDESDAESWTITARGKQFTPARRGMINPHAQCLKSVVYSE
jgi:trimethylamine-N-oxide reductase (cytochrome c)